jgi:inosine/xanthosine triphosphatase
MLQKTVRVMVGSKNPVKINAANDALSLLCSEMTIESVGVTAPSGVPDQPMTEDETKLGAVNRVLHCRQYHQADYYMAMEGGVHLFDFGPATFAYVAIANNVNEEPSIGRGALLPLPMPVYEALQAGEELGHVMDRLFNTDNIKQKGGAIGLLTNHVATRQGNYTQALVLAMAPFMYPDFFATKG